jgi:mannosyltransferase
VAARTVRPSGHLGSVWPAVGTLHDQRRYFIVGAFVFAPELVCVAALTVVAAGLRLYGITSKDIWYDEAFVLTIAQLPVADIVRSLVELDPHPPLYYVLMHPWLALVGTDPLMARLPSALLSTASVPLLYVTGAHLAGRRAALAGTALLAFSSFHIYWAQEARMYSMLGLLGLASTYFLVRALREGAWSLWALHALAVAAALFTHVAAVFYLAAQAAAVLVLLARRRGFSPIAIRWFASQVVAGLLFLPWVPELLAQGEAYNLDAFARTSFAEAYYVLFELTYANFPYWSVPVGATGVLWYALALVTRATLMLSALLLAIVGAWSIRRRQGGVLLPFLFVGAVVLLLLEGLWRGIVVPKAAFLASFAFLLLIGAGLASSGRRGVLIAGIATIAALNLVGVARYHQLGSQEEWKQAIEYLTREVQVGEPVLVDASAGLIPLNYHLERRGGSLETHGIPFRPWAVVPPPLTDDDFRHVDALTANRATIWVLIYRNGFADPDGQLLPYLTSTYAVADVQTLAKIRIFRLERPQAADSPAEDGQGSSSAARAPASVSQVPLLAAQQPSDQAPIPSGPRVYFGAWVGERVNVPGDMDAFERAIGRSPAIVHRYSDNPPHYGQRFDKAWADGVRANGSIPMLSWQPGFGYGTRSLASVAAGEADEYIRTWADQLRDWGHPIFLRMMWEQNLALYGWRAYQEPQTSEFIASWRHIVNVFRARGASNVTFVWSPNVSGNGAGEIMLTYPGDEYVDWVALDGYPFRNGRGDFAETFGPDYDLLVSQVPRPIMIAETSLDSWSDDLKAERIREILEVQIPARFPHVQALVWFEEKDTGGIDYSILQDQGPRSQEAFRLGISSPYYAANGYGDLAVTPIPPPAALAYAPPPAPSAAAAQEPTQGNQVVDAGFEDGSGDGRPDAWSPAWIVPPWMAAVVRRDSGGAMSGAYSMLHSSTKGESYSVHQEIPVVAGVTYDVSVSVLVESALKNGKASLEVHSLNTHGGVIHSSPIGSWREATDGWQRVQGRVKVATGAARARVVVRVAGLRGTFRLDDFSFTRAT